jgi:hypothetical protein
VWEVQYGGYHLQKGRLEEELVQFLMDSEKARNLFRSRLDVRSHSVAVASTEL